MKSKSGEVSKCKMLRYVMSWDEVSRGEMALGRNIYGVKCRWDEMFMGCNAGANPALRLEEGGEFLERPKFMREIFPNFSFFRPIFENFR